MGCLLLFEGCVCLFGFAFAVGSAAAFVEVVTDFFAAATVAFDVLDLVARVGLSSDWMAESGFASFFLARGLIGMAFFFLGFGDGGVDASDSL